jgi:hypothetical protein
MKLVLALVVTAVAANAADTLAIFGRTWTVPALSDWTIDRDHAAPVLRLSASRGPLPGPRRPIQFALTGLADYERVTVEADVMPLGSSLLIVFAYRDEAHFDYAHLSTDPASSQPVHNGIFHVYGGERVRISPDRGPAAFAASGRWFHIKLTHDALAGAVRVMVDGQPLPALEAVDRSLGPGKLGMGSFDETGAFKNVTIRVESGPRSHPPVQPAQPPR